MRLWDGLVDSYQSIRKMNASNIRDFRGRVKAWMKMAILTGRIFYDKDIWAKDVAALTFSSFMALIPFMAMMFVIARGFGYTELLEEWIGTTFESQPIVAQTIIDFVHNYIENTQGDYIIGTGIVLFLYTILSLMQKIERTFDSIWHAGERSWKKMITEYPTILCGLGLMILFASSINVWALRVVESVDGMPIVGDTIPAFILHLAAFIPMFLFFVFCYYVIPNTYIRFRCTLVPSLLAGICMSALQYGYFYLQAFLSSYNVIYGSLAAIPLFLLWLQISWAIVVFGALLCYAKQNLHLYDGDLSYMRLKYSTRLKICCLVMEHVCRRFGEGKPAYTPKELHDLMNIPQQIVNEAVKELLLAQLLVEIKSGQTGAMEEAMRVLPIEDIAHLTDETIRERLFSYGEDIEI